MGVWCIQYQVERRARIQEKIREDRKVWSRRALTPEWMKSDVAVQSEDRGLTAPSTLVQSIRIPCLVQTSTKSRLLNVIK